VERAVRRNGSPEGATGRLKIVRAVVLLVIFSLCCKHPVTYGPRFRDGGRVQVLMEVTFGAGRGASILLYALGYKLLGGRSGSDSFGALRKTAVQDRRVMSDLPGRGGGRRGGRGASWGLASWNNGQHCFDAWKGGARCYAGGPR